MSCNFVCAPPRIQTRFGLAGRNLHVVPNSPELLSFGIGSRVFESVLRLARTEQNLALPRLRLAFYAFPRALLPKTPINQSANMLA